MAEMAAHEHSQDWHQGEGSEVMACDTNWVFSAHWVTCIYYKELSWIFIGYNSNELHFPDLSKVDQSYLMAGMTKRKHLQKVRTHLWKHLYPLWSTTISHLSP